MKTVVEINKHIVRTLENADSVGMQAAEKRFLAYLLYLEEDGRAEESAAAMVRMWTTLDPCAPGERYKFIAFCRRYEVLG